MRAAQQQRPQQQRPHLECMRQLVVLAHHPPRVARVVAHKRCRARAPMELFGVLEEEENEHEGGDERGQQQIEDAAQEKPAS